MFENALSDKKDLPLQKSFSSIMEMDFKPTKYKRSREYWEKQDKPYLIAEVEALACEIFQLKKTITQ